MEMDKEIYLSSLYDYYSPLLTDKQKDYFEDYYFNNLSLAEIAENNDTSRNAIHKQIKDTENKRFLFALEQRNTAIGVCVLLLCATILGVSTRGRILRLA